MRGHHFVITRNKQGEYVARFMYNSEWMFGTDGYSTKESAKNAIASIQKNGPAAEVIDNT